MCMILTYKFINYKFKYAHRNPIYATSYLIAIVRLRVSFTDCEKFAVEMCMTLTLTFRMDQGQNENMPVEKPRATFYFMVLSMFAR